jgi:sugar phosphate isomerase/epimerase
VPLVCLDTSIELASPFERELSASIDLASDWGAPAIRVFGGAGGGVDDIARRLEPELARAGERGVTVALETHDHFSSAVLVAELLDRVGDPSFAAIWDLHHPYRVGESPDEVLRALGTRVCLVHVKDARRHQDGWQLVALEEGEIPVRASINGLRAAGYDGFFTVEWEKRWHPELAEPAVALPRERATLLRWLA